MLPLRATKTTPSSTIVKSKPDEIPDFLAIALHIWKTSMYVAIGTYVAQNGAIKTRSGFCGARRQHCTIHNGKFLAYWHEKAIKIKDFAP